MVTMSEQSDVSLQKTAKSSSSSFKIDPYTLLKFLLSHWYWYVFIVGLFASYQWYRYTKTQFEYGTSASVMIKDPKVELQDAGLNRLAGGSSGSSQGLANEILQFQNPQYMADAIWRLHAEVDYVVRDYLRDWELYSKTPVRVSFVDASQEDIYSLSVTIVDGENVRLADFSHGSSRDLLAPIGRTVITPIGRLRITKTPSFLAEWIGKTIIVRKNSLDAVVSRMMPLYRVIPAEAPGMGGGGMAPTMSRSSSILNLTFRDVSPDRAADIVNTVIEIYKEENVKDNSSTAVNTSTFIDERLALIEKDLDDVEEQIQNYKQANEMIDVGQEAGQAMSKREVYGEQAIELMMQARLGRSLYDYLTDPNKENELIPSQAGFGDAALEKQINAYNTAKLKRDKLLSESSNKNPVVEDLNNSLAAMRQTIKRSVENMNININMKLNEVNSREGQARARVSDAPRKQRQMLSIERQQKIKQELYLYLLNKREENALQLATTASNARVLRAAHASRIPIYPKRNEMVMKGVSLGLLITTALLLCLLFFDNRIRDRKDIEEATSVPFLGEIPKQKTRKGLAEVVVNHDGHDAVSEAFRIIRANMTFMQPKSEEGQVITFSSFAAGAGKTFISANLAASFALMGKKVILIDLDIRKGTMTTRVGTRQQEGITTFLAGHAELDDIIFPSEKYKGVDMIPSGPIPPNPAELLVSERLDAVIRELRTRYDYIFVDNVPYGIIADATITNRIADITIFVIRAGRYDRRMLPEVENVYQSHKLKNLCLILNGAIIRRRGYGYGYGYGKDTNKTENPTILGKLRWKKHGLSK